MRVNYRVKTAQGNNVRGSNEQNFKLNSWRSKTKIVTPDKIEFT